MDITVEVMLPPRGETDLSAMTNGSYRILAPVAVYPLKATAVVGMQRTGYVHVTGVPVVDKGSEELTFAHLNRILCERWDNADGSSREKRKWCGVPVAVPSAIVAQFLAERQTTITWVQFKALLRHQVDIRNLTDEDIA